MRRLHDKIPASAAAADGSIDVLQIEESRALLEGHGARERDGVGVQERRACHHGRRLLGGLALGLEHHPNKLLLLVPTSSIVVLLLRLVAFDPDERPDGAPGHLVHVVYPDGLGSPHLGVSPVVTLLPVPGVLAQPQRVGVGCPG